MSTFTETASVAFRPKRHVPTALAGELMPLLSGTGRLYLRAEAAAALVPALYDGDPPWDFVLALRRRPDGIRKTRSPVFFGGARTTRTFRHRWS